VTNPSSTNACSSSVLSTDFLIEARIPKVNNEKSLNPLTRQLLADKLATLHQLALADGQISDPYRAYSKDPHQDELQRLLTNESLLLEYHN
jgi:hypothetical protein